MSALTAVVNSPTQPPWRVDEMPTMVTGSDIREAVEQETFIQGGDVACVEGVKYDFRMSPRILQAKYQQPIDATRLTEMERLELRVDPGEVVFVLTEERLALPRDMVAQLSPKRKLSHAGILTLGGFTIDPDYVGRLLVGLFNFSSTPFPLSPGKKLIAATFFRLEGREAGNFPHTGEPLEDFPDELVQVMQKYHPVAVLSVAETVQKLQTELVSLRTEIRSHEDWYQRFKQALDTNNAQIGALTADLANEREVRKGGQDQLTTAVESIEKTLSFLKGAAWVVIGILGTALAIVGSWVAKAVLGA
jgi:deoxycytidine triphosphate deaminase